MGRNEIIQQLRSLVLAADDSVLRDIAEYDRHGGGGVTYQEACELHFQGLKDLIENCDVKADWAKHFWYPMEAVELRSFTPLSGNQVSFGVATAILFLDELSGGERDFAMERSSDRYLQAYRNLPDAFSIPLLAAQKTLLED